MEIRSVTDWGGLFNLQKVNKLQSLTPAIPARPNLRPGRGRVQQLLAAEGAPPPALLPPVKPQHAQWGLPTLLGLCPPEHGEGRAGTRLCC